MKLHILTQRHNEQALHIIELNKEISLLKEALKMKQGSQDGEDCKSLESRGRLSSVASSLNVA